MELNYFDLGASIIILLLGLKGIVNGFFKELFGLIGIIGGIYLASRIGDKVGAYLSKLIFHFDNQNVVEFSGFLITLILFWAVMIMLGSVFKELSSHSGLGIIDRLLGFIFGAGKFFLIASIIAFAAYNVKAVKTTIDKSLHNSVLFPIMVDTGRYIMKIDPVSASKDMNKSLGKATQKVSETIDNVVGDVKESIATDTQK